MNKKDLDKAEKLARKFATNNISISDAENKNHKRTGWILTIDGKQFGSLDSLKKHIQSIEASSYE